jgi:hypothetical protein
MAPETRPAHGDADYPVLALWVVALLAVATIATAVAAVWL